MNVLAASVCDHFKSVGVLCPPTLQKGLFTVGAIMTTSTTILRQQPLKVHSMELG